jgi:hypothetical protein
MLALRVDDALEDEDEFAHAVEVGLLSASAAAAHAPPRSVRLSEASLVS